MVSTSTIGAPINSVRHRVLRQCHAKINPTPHSALDLPPLGPGEMQLYSYFTPGLLTGHYNIEAEQTIVTSDGTQSKTIRAPAQSFLIDAPRFSIDPALIHSVFPQQGVAAQANILPHVVLNDPHLPWQTEIEKTSEKDALRVPWLAALAFEQSELKLPADDTLPPQSSTMAIRITIEQLKSLGSQFVIPDPGTSVEEDKTSIDVIFLDMDLFLALFGSATKSDPPQIDLDRFKYLAHTRQVNTIHMTDSGILDEGQFSVVFSHRTGPPFEKDAPVKPKRCVAHLVSLDWVHRIPQSALTPNKRVALISLFSWTYDCVPPETVNFEDVMREVGKNRGVYRTPDEIRNNLQGDLPPAIQNRIKDRLEDGYTLIRYRVQTGEETIALMRGPLIPYAVPDDKWMDVHSHSGEDLQIIDTQLGLVDVSYSVAWQLGKSLAIADQAFCAALLRIRAFVYDTASKLAKGDILSKKFHAATSERVIDSLSQHFTYMQQLSKQPFNEQRFKRPPLVQSRYKHLAENPEGYRGSIKSRLQHQVEHLGSATDGTPYTEFKDPISTDWALVLDWILDKIYLDKVPPWYLIPDSTWLPTESIRFFYVDHMWLSALIDGALSIANHSDEEDKLRKWAKEQLQKYLKGELHDKLPHPPQVPSYGFFLRSVAVDAFPDMVVRAPWPTLDNGQQDLRAEVLRQENIRKDIMFCLLDRTPEKLQQLIINQPPHQQCFMFGHDSTFTTESFELELRKVYSVRTNKPMDELPKKPFSKGPDGRCEIYDWNTRTILVDKFTTLISDTLKDEHQKDNDIYHGDSNASLVGIELNDPIYRLTFKPTQPSSTAGQPPEASDKQSFTFSFPGEAAAPPPVTRQFEGVPLARVMPRGPPRMSGLPPPALATPHTDKSKEPPATMSASVTQSSIVPEIRPILLDIDYDSTEHCPTRFSPTCFPIGKPSTAKDDETKYLTWSASGSDIIVRLARNQSDPESTDYIHIFEIRIPLGTTTSSLFTEPLGVYAVQMLNTMRIFADVGIYENEVIIHLKPKEVSKLSPLSHNPDMSFMINGAKLNPGAVDSTISIVELYTSEGGNLKIALNYIHHIQVKKEE